MCSFFTDSSVMLSKIIVLYIFQVVTSTDPDPCLSSKQINDVGIRGTNCKLNSNLICDRNGFEPGWYSAMYNGDFVEIPTSCPDVSACGTGSPIWINGTNPGSVGEVVSTTACVRGFRHEDTCVAYYQIEIKNCSGFYVYNLPYVELCPFAYCFGNHTCEKKLTTYKNGLVDPSVTTPLPQTDPCIHAAEMPNMHKRGSECSPFTLKKQLCDRSLRTGWYKAVDNNIFYDMPTYCVDVETCGTEEPIWLNGSIPEFDDGIVYRNACVRGFVSGDCCQKTIGIQVRNCFTYNVYYLTYTDLCHRAYCFGKRGCIKENPDKEVVKEQDGIITKSGYIIPYVLSGCIFMVLVIVVLVFILYLKTKRVRIGNSKEDLMNMPPPYSESGPKKVLTTGMSPEIVATMAFDKKTKN